MARIPGGPGSPQEDEEDDGGPPDAPADEEVVREFKQTTRDTTTDETTTDGTTTDDTAADAPTDEEVVREFQERVREEPAPADDATDTATADAGARDTTMRSDQDAIDAALASASPAARRQQRGAESAGGPVGEQARGLEQDIVAGTRFGPEDVAVRREGDRLVPEFTPLGRARERERLGAAVGRFAPVAAADPGRPTGIEAVTPEGGLREIQRTAVEGRLEDANPDIAAGTAAGIGTRVEDGDIAPAVTRAPPGAMPADRQDERAEDVLRQFHANVSPQRRPADRVTVEDVERDFSAIEGDTRTVGAAGPLGVTVPADEEVGGLDLEDLSPFDVTFQQSAGEGAAVPAGAPGAGVLAGDTGRAAGDLSLERFDVTFQQSAGEGAAVPAGAPGAGVMVDEPEGSTEGELSLRNLGFEFQQSDVEGPLAPRGGPGAGVVVDEPGGEGGAVSDLVPDPVEGQATTADRGTPGGAPGAGVMVSDPDAAERDLSLERFDVTFQQSAGEGAAVPAGAPGAGVMVDDPEGSTEGELDLDLEALSTGGDDPGMPTREDLAVTVTDIGGTIDAPLQGAFRRRQQRETIFVDREVQQLIDDPPDIVPEIGLLENAGAFVEDPVGTTREAIPSRDELAAEIDETVSRAESAAGRLPGAGTAGALASFGAPVAAAEPTPAGEIGLGLGIAAVVGTTAAAEGARRFTVGRAERRETDERQVARTGEIDVDEPQQEQSELVVREPATSEFDVPSQPARESGELAVGGDVFGAELEPGEPVVGSELSIGEPDGEAGERAAERDSVVPGDFPLPGRDVPADPARDFVRGPRPEDIVAGASPVVEGSLRQRVEDEAEEPEPADPREITEEDIETDLPDPRDVPPSNIERMRREDLTAFERRFPTGAGAVVGRAGLLHEEHQRLEAAQRQEVLEEADAAGVDAGLQAGLAAAQEQLGATDLRADTLAGQAQAQETLLAQRALQRQSLVPEQVATPALSPAPGFAPETAVGFPTEGVGVGQGFGSAGASEIDPTLRADLDADDRRRDRRLGDFEKRFEFAVADPGELAEGLDVDEVDVTPEGS